MRPTINIIIIFFIVFPLLLLSYQLGTPAISKTEAGLGEYLNGPALKTAPPVPVRSKTDGEAMPKKISGTDDPDILAVSAIAWDFKQDLFLFKKNADETRPIASMTKLITAAIVLDYAQTSETTAISKEAIRNEGSSGNLREGEILTIYDLLAAALMESSNDAAYALAEYVGGKLSLSGSASQQAARAFVRAMNQKFNDLGLIDSNFTDPTGLEDSKSFSTASDFAAFIKYLRNNKNYDALWEILELKTYQTRSQNNIAEHEFKSTNTLLDELDGVIGGKTGYTNNALGNLLLVLKGPNDTEIIYVVMGSTDRFGDMKKLIEWVEKSWQWPNPTK